MNMRKKVLLLILSFVFLTVSFLIGPVDIFKHGFYSIESTYTELDGKELENTTVLKITKKHFKGLEIRLPDLPNDSAGKLTFVIRDKNGKMIEKNEISLNGISSGDWHQIHFTHKLKEGEEYFLSVPDLSTFLMLKSAYAESTFSFSEKILIISMLFFVWLFFINKLAIRKKEKIYNILVKVVIFGIMTICMTWNFMYNTFGSSKINFDAFDIVSENLVVSVIEAERNNANLGEYGIGEYINIRGNYVKNRLTIDNISNPNSLYTSEDDYFHYYPNGYCSEEPAIGVLVK